MIRNEAQRGFSLIEVMITMFIVAVGLLGLAGLQARAISAEVEAFSRGQALVLASDLADRMGANLAGVKSGDYDQDGVVFGAGYANDCISATNDTAAEQMSCCAAKATVAARDICEWDLALKGIAVSSAGGEDKLGAMAGARGCVFEYDDNVFEIDVVWQGRGAGPAMAADMTCAAAAIPSNRRGVSRRIRVAQLDAT